MTAILVFFVKIMLNMLQEEDLKLNFASWAIVLRVLLLSISLFGIDRSLRSP